MLENEQIAAVRDVTDRYAGTGRVLTHTIVHPNLGTAELDRMPGWSRRLCAPSAWKVYTLAGPPTAASPTGGWFLDDDEIGAPFLERVRELGPRIVCAHKGLGGPIPDASVAAASPRDIGPAAAAFPDITFVVYHSGYERDPHGEEGAFDPVAPIGRRPVDRLRACVRHRRAGIGRRQRVCRAGQHLVPHAAPAGRGRARAGQAARPVRARRGSCGGPTAPGTDRPSR